MSTYTIRTLSEHWDCSPDVLYDLIRKGELKAFKLGSTLRITAEEVDRFENKTVKEITPHD